MKHINRYIILSAITLSALTTACNDKLDTLAEDKSYVSTTDYTQSENMIQPITGLYSNLYDFGWERFPLISVRGDDVNAGGLGDQPDLAATDRYTYNKDYWMYNSVWNGLYSTVFNAYSTIDQVEKYRSGGASNQLANQYVGEAKVIRGYMLFLMSRVWGDIFIPADFDPTHLTTAKTSPKDSVMAYISRQMDEAIPALPDMRPNQRTDLVGGVTKYTALAIKALANLELRNYQDVANATGQIIQSGKFTLEPDYYNLFKIKGKLDNENIFEFQYSDFGQPTGGKNFGWGFYGPQGWSPKVTGSSDGWGFWEPSMKYIKFMLDRGETTRLETSVLFTNKGIDSLKKEGPKYAVLPSWISNTTRSGDVLNDFAREIFVSGKHYLPSDQLTPGRKDYSSNKNMTCIRYAEILLMYAEALTQGATGSAGTAVNAVNLVRTRAGLTSLSSVTNDQVMDEKYAELAMEWGTRYFDMVRLKKYNELSYDGRTFDESKSFLPYPQAQVDLLPGLRK